MKSKSFFKKWTKYIVEGQIDSDNVVKVVLYNDKNEVLFLKRTDYVDAYKGEWDLPGGHAHIGEDIVKALRREVREETKLSFKKPIKIKKIGNITFYKAKYDGGDIGNGGAVVIGSVFLSTFVTFSFALLINTLLSRAPLTALAKLNAR